MELSALKDCSHLLIQQLYSLTSHERTRCSHIPHLRVVSYIKTIKHCCSSKRPHPWLVSGNSSGGTPREMNMLWALLLGSCCVLDEVCPHPEPPVSLLRSTLTLSAWTYHPCARIWRHTTDAWTSFSSLYLYAWILDYICAPDMSQKSVRDIYPCP